VAIRFGRMGGWGGGREDCVGAGVGGCELGGLGGHAPWKGGPWCLEVSLPWRVAAGRDEGVESEWRGKSKCQYRE
jgi:hypothetical protein